MWLFQALVSSCLSTRGLDISSFHLKMSDFSESDSTIHSGCHSEGESSVNTLWLLRMYPRCTRCRTPELVESAHAHHKFKGIPGSYAVR